MVATQKLDLWFLCLSDKSNIDVLCSVAIKNLRKNSSELLSTYQELLTKYTFFVNFVSFLAISLSMRFLVVMVMIVLWVVMVCCVIWFNWWILTKWCDIAIAGDLWTYRKLNGLWNIRFFRQGEDLAIEWWRKVHHKYVEAVSLFTSVITVHKIWETSGSSLVSFTRKLVTRWN